MGFITPFIALLISPHCRYKKESVYLKMVQLFHPLNAQISQLPRRCWGQPHVYMTMTISLAEFMFMKKGQQAAGFVEKGRLGLVDFLPKI